PARPHIYTLSLHDALPIYRGIVRLVRDTDYMVIAPTDAVTQTSSISFDAATWEIWTALINGAHLVGISKDELINADSFRQRLREDRKSTRLNSSHSQISYA